MLEGYPYLEIRYITNDKLRKKYHWGNREQAVFPPDWIQSEHLSIRKQASLSCEGDDDADTLKQNRLKMLANAATLQWATKNHVYEASSDDERI